jgi:myosin heavy subunit
MPSNNRRRLQLQMHLLRDNYLYAVAQRMYRNLVAEDHHRDQSLMISGDSVAGKTESTKFVVRFLCQEAGTAATIGGAPSPCPDASRLL